VTDLWQILECATGEYDESQFGLPPLKLVCLCTIFIHLLFFVFQNGPPEEIARERRRREHALQYRHGLTPPMHNARRHLRKPVQKKTIDAPELDVQLKKLLRDDIAVRLMFIFYILLRLCFLGD
jgi:hypothetical protein